MQLASGQLLPLDGFTYETPYGTFIAALLTPPLETCDPDLAQKVEIEFRNECHGFHLTRRLSLLVSRQDLTRDLPGVIRFITKWVFIDPSHEVYFAHECRYEDNR
jgi:hypothetical protein